MKHRPFARQPIECTLELVDRRGGPMNRPVVVSVRTGGKGDVTQSQVVWKETKGVPEVPSPLVWRDRVYLIRSGGLLVCRLAAGIWRGPTLSEY